MDGIREAVRFTRFISQHIPHELYIIKNNAILYHGVRRSNYNDKDNDDFLKDEEIKRFCIYIDPKHKDLLKVKIYELCISKITYSKDGNILYYSDIPNTQYISNKNSEIVEYENVNDIFTIKFKSFSIDFKFCQFDSKIRIDKLDNLFVENREELILRARMKCDKYLKFVHDSLEENDYDDLEYSTLGLLYYSRVLKLLN